MKVPLLIVPLSVAVAAAGGYWASFLFAIPSLTMDYPSGSGDEPGSCASVTLLVNGIRCVDTARDAGSALGELPGIRRFVAYASRGRVDIAFDPRVLQTAQIVKTLEGPVWNEPAGEYRFGVYRVVEVDGRKLAR